MDEVSEPTFRLAKTADRESHREAHPNGPIHIRRSPYSPPHHRARADGEPPSGRPPVIGFLAAAELILRRWYWLLLGGVALALGGYFAGQRLFQPSYLASAELLRLDASASTDYYKPRDFSADTFASLIKSPELLQQVGGLCRPRLTPDQLAARIGISPDHDSDLITITASGDSPQLAVELANLYAEQAVRHTRALQAKDAAEANETLKQNLADMESRMQKLNAQLQAAPRIQTLQPGTQATALGEKLQTAEAELVILLGRLTDKHPDVIDKKRTVENLRAELKRLNEKSAAAAAAGDPGKKASEPDPDLVRSQLATIAGEHHLLTTRQREARWFAEHPPGYCRIFAPAKASEVHTNGWDFKVMFLAVVGGMMGLVGTLGLVAAFEFMDQRLKTSEDLERVTGLPVITTLGEIHRMSSTAQSNWAFRAWTALQHHLSPSPNQGLVCGFTSCGHGEGRSTWINLLAQAASQCGFRVLTIGTIRMPENGREEARDEKKPVEMPPPGTPETEASNAAAMLSGILNSPGQVTQQLSGEESPPFVHIPLPGWVWSLERRKQWQQAMNEWTKIENVVIFIELPPAGEPEGVLLASNLPNLVWLARSGYPAAGETRSLLQTLRNARCRLVGCVLNQAFGQVLKNRFARWVSCGLLALGIAGAARAAEAEPETSPAPQGSFSVLAPSQRAEWQKRLTLGPGDTLQISLFGQAELDRKEVVVGPDGRINFLHAVDVPAAGLTVDELRQHLNQALSDYYRTPRTIIVPTSYRSKKYYVLGKVVHRGVFLLDRPVTIIEAVARAHGLETGLLDSQNVTDLADLQRSFLMRKGQRMPVNFEKLFQEGDLSQNIPLEPDDYLYFAAGTAKEIYVLGEVRVPGPVLYKENTTVLTALAERGGYTDRAFKSRVLVIRGSLNKPQTFVVDTWAALDARGQDFKLAPKDIIYVHNRPFIKVEELLDLAATAFIQSVITAWTGDNIGPLITSPIVPNL